MNTTTYRSFKEVLQESLEDPETRAEWDRTQLAQDVSLWLLRYRKDHGLTQTELAESLGWKQPVVARLESGEHEPTITTLQHLVSTLGTTAKLEIGPTGVAVRFSKPLRHLKGKRTTARRRSRKLTGAAA